MAEPARRALAYALAAQGPNGGWKYEPGQPGDMSVTGWYMMALKSAQMAGLEVPKGTPVDYTVSTGPEATRRSSSRSRSRSGSSRSSGGSGSRPR